MGIGGMRKGVWAVALAAASLGAGMLLPAASQAAFPGENGLLTWDDGAIVSAARPDGSRVSILTAGRNAKFSAQGHMVLERHGATGSDLYYGDQNGQGLTQITFTPGVDEIEPTVNSFGRRIGFSRISAGDFDLWAIDSDGGFLTQVSSGTARETGMTFSPDGTKIAFASGNGTNDQIYVFNTDGTGLPLRLTFAGNNGFPDFSPDGQRIAFERFTTGPTAGFDVFSIKIDGTEETNLTNSADRDEGFPAYSPDGTKIAFDSSPTTDDTQNEIRVMPATGGAQTTLVPGLGPIGGLSWAIRENDPPDSSITEAPSNPGNDSTPSFKYSSSEPHSQFQCRLYAASATTPPAFTGCGIGGYTSPVRPDGAYKFEVRAVDLTGNVDPTPASMPFTIDTTPPQWTIIGAGSATSDPTPTFVSTENESLAANSQMCRIQPAIAFASCGQFYTSSALADGSYTFEVKGTDLAGNDGSSTYPFRVDTTPPTTAIQSGPSGPTNEPQPSFTFNANETVQGFECRLSPPPGTGTFTACNSGSFQPPAPLAEGDYLFEARAKDQVGWQGAATSRSFTVDLTPPTVAVTGGPSGETVETQPQFTFTASDGSASCHVDDDAFAACTSPYTTPPLTAGDHLFEVQASDPAGNTSAPASRAFTVAAPAPPGGGTLGEVSPPGPSPPAQRKCKKKKRKHRSASAAKKKKCKRAKA
jgi:hypothetical protein